MQSDPHTTRTAMIREWLTRQLTQQDVEEVATGDSPRWRRLLDQMQPGDELWEFNSPPPNWQHLAGRAGYSLVRNGEIIDSIITMMN